MRPLVIGGLATLLAACTLLVPIDDDVSTGVGANKPGDGGKDTGLIQASSEGGEDVRADAEAPFDSGEPFGPAREGCPNGVSLDPDLLAYYPFDETAGSILHDCSQKANDLNSLTAVVPKWSDGHVAGAADFDGVDGCFGSTDTNLDKFEGEPFSVSVWTLTRQFFDPNKAGRWVIGHKVSPSGWHIGVDDPNRFELDLEWVTENEHKTQISSEIALNTWTHFVTTYTNTGEGAVYKNGVLTEKQTSAAKVPPTFGTGTNVFLRVGCRGSKSGTYDGKIDELRIYAGVLSEERIRQLAEAR